MTHALPARLATATLLAALFGCQSQPSFDMPATRHEAPPTNATAAIALPGLHNVVTYAEELVCGGVPEGDEGFATLQGMGIRTIISVDGATPDLAAAGAHGMRYVHLPISYDTVTPERQRQLAQAIENLEYPIYVHCHHGKHRSAAALGTAMVTAGKLPTDDAIARMQVSGTSPSYTGLWQAVRDAQPLAKDQLQADPSAFPSVTKVTGMVATMAEIDQVIDLVKQAKEAGWRAPDDHPDLVAPKETKRLHALLQGMRKDEESIGYPDDYQQMLGQAITASARLDEAVRGGDGETAASSLAELVQTCKSCHKSYRNQ